MRWLMAAIYMPRHREIVAAEDVPLHHAPGVVDIAYPNCGQPIFADLASDDDAPEQDVNGLRGGPTSSS
jgi:hypothetical protein